MAAAIKRGLAATSFGQIHYREAGSGPAIVLLHINQQSSAVMAELLEALAPGMHAIAPDYPSHGGSDHLARQPTIEDYARCVLELLDALKVKSFVALGEATGAAVAVALANEAPARVRRIAMVNCPLLEADVAAGLLAALRDVRPADDSGFPALRSLQYLLHQDPDHAPMHPTQDWMDRINRAQVEAGRDRWQALRALIQYDLASALERVRCPALLLTGEHFYFGHRVPEIAKRVGHLKSKTLLGARFCATWERAGEVAKLALQE